MLRKRDFNRRNLHADIRCHPRRDRHSRRYLHHRNRERRRLVHAGEGLAHPAQGKLVEDQGLIARLGHILVDAWIVARSVQ